MSKFALFSFLSQKEWQITLDRDQLNEMWSASALHWSHGCIQYVRVHVRFWVISSAEQVEKYLYSRLNVISRFLEYDLLDLKPGGSHCVIKALHKAIHQGGEVIILLSEHKYRQTGQQPWIHHRFKKLVITERWLSKTIKLLLSQGISDVAYPYFFHGLSLHAQNHNARTLCVWMKVMRACAEDHPRRVSIADSKNHSTNTKSDGLQ